MGICTPGNWNTNEICLENGSFHFTTNASEFVSGSVLGVFGSMVGENGVC